jgi:riboflavin synthase
MFTGLVEARGTLARRSPASGGARLFVEAPLSPLVLGESIATDGVCLTVEALGPGGFYATASAETLEHTTLGGKALGAPVNLERALAVGARLGGHLVGGHVDGVGRVAASRAEGGGTRVSFTYPRPLARFIAEKGSIAVNGVSLTVNGVEDTSFHVVLVPHTAASTAWTLEVGTLVNLEVDVLARYVARALSVASAEPPERIASDEAWLTTLGRAGYL